MTHEQIEKQRQLFYEHKARKELEETQRFHEETRRRNEEETNKILAEVAQREKEKLMEEKRKQQEAYEQFKREQPRKYVQQLFPNKPSHPVYYMDTDMNLQALWGKIPYVHPSTPMVSKTSNNTTCDDELVNTIWPRLRSLEAQREQIRATLKERNRQITNVRHFAMAAYRTSVLNTFIKLHTINIQIRTTGALQKQALETCWRACSHTPQ